ncbi:TPA: primase-like DNA-binding domain-containing protein [Vibrio cholerae]
MNHIQKALTAMSKHPESRLWDDATKEAFILGFTSALEVETPRPVMDTSVKSFMEGLVTVHPAARCSQSVLYAAYNAWCNDLGVRALTKRQLKTAILEAYPEVRFAQAMRIGETVTRGFYGLGVNV